MVALVHAAFALLILTSTAGHGLTTARNLQEETEEEDKSITEELEDFFFDDNCDRTKKDTSKLSDLSNWMSTIDPSTRLGDITLPGTHHSASYDLSTTVNPYDPEYLQIKDATYGFDVPKLIAPMICRFALTQSLSISEQLQAGIRYFDLRIDFEDDTSTFRAFHVLFGHPVEILLGQIADFVREHPTEIVLVEISELLNIALTTADKARLQASILDAFGNMLLPAADDLPTVGEMQDAKTTVIVTVQDDEVADNALLWDDSIIKNTFANTVEVSTMTDYNTQRLADFESESSDKRFYKLSWTLTPDSDYIKDSIISGSLYDLAVDGNGALKSFATDNEGKQLGNVLLLDFPEASPLFDVLKLSDKSEGKFMAESGATTVSTTLKSLGLVCITFFYLV